MSSVFDFVQPYTMTSLERVTALCDAVDYVVRHKIPGDIVECGVWRGGSMMAVAKRLLEIGEYRDLYLFDTFCGMSESTSIDIDFMGRVLGEAADWDFLKVSLPEVQTNMATVGYPSEKIHYIEGLVEETVPDSAPPQIAILRLDTDWYESTKYELEHLAPLMAPGGVLIIDDYGHWMGCQKAVEEWIDRFDKPIFLSRIDFTGRIAIMP